MKQIRNSIFETNSSSVHSLTFCTVEEYNKFLNGELYLDTYNNTLCLPPNPKDEFDSSIYSIRELEREMNTGSWHVEVDKDIITLKDGNTFAYIKYDYTE